MSFSKVWGRGRRLEGSLFEGYWNSGLGHLGGVLALMTLIRLILQEADAPIYWTLVVSRGQLDEGGGKLGDESNRRRSLKAACTCCRSSICFSNGPMRAVQSVFGVSA